MNYYVYSITNLINGKIYIGRSKFQKNSKYYFGSGNLIKEAIKKYGKKNFKKDILEYCETLIESKEREIFLIDKYKSITPIGYNISKGGEDGDWYDNYPHKEEFKKKSSENSKKIWKEQREKMLNGLSKVDWLTINRNTAKKIKKIYEDNPHKRIEVSNRMKAWIKTDKGKKHIKKLSEINKDRYKNMTEEEKIIIKEKINKWDREKRREKVKKYWTEDKRKECSEKFVNEKNPRANDFYVIYLDNKKVEYYGCIKSFCEKHDVHKRYVLWCIREELGYYKNYIFLKNKPNKSNIEDIISNKMKMGTTQKVSKVETIMVKDLCIYEFETRQDCAKFLGVKPKIIINRVNKNKEYKGYRFYEN